MEAVLFLTLVKCAFVFVVTLIAVTWGFRSIG